MAAITIRAVPDGTHPELTARAALNGQSLQDYLRARLVDIASRPDPAALMARVHDRKQAAGSTLSADRILSYRDRDRT